MERSSRLKLVGLTAAISLALAISLVFALAPIASASSALPGFSNPSASDRMKVRAGSADANAPATLAELAISGFGAAELGLNFDSSGPTLLTAALGAAKSNGISVDLAPGGGMPYASPGISEQDSLQQLSSWWEIRTSDGTYTYNSQVPKPAGLAGSPVLVAVTAAKVTGTDAGGTTLLDPGSAVDLSAFVNSSGYLNWTVPAGDWAIFAFWQRATGRAPFSFGFPDGPFPTSPAAWNSVAPNPSNGYFWADIFSGKGIGSALDYLRDSGYLSPYNLKLLKGTQFAEDSLEVQAEMFWTGDLPAQFKGRRGYSMIKYLPALQTPKESWFNPLQPFWGVTGLTRQFDFTGDIGQRVRHDYYLTLTDLYVDRYLATFTNKLHSYGMSSRVEVAYNYAPLNMTRAGQAVDIPENESFDSGWGVSYDPTIPQYGTDRWLHMMDSYRLTGSGAHLSGAKRATAEFGDDFAAYRKQPVDYAQQLNELLAGGITMGLLTGFSSVDTSWPVAGGLWIVGLGDNWTKGWPQWRDWKPLNDYFARSTVVLETGKAQMDAVIYLDDGLSGVHELTTPKFASTCLMDAGFSYDFVDPVSIASKEANAVPGSLFGNGPAYKAIVLNKQVSIPVDAANAILKAARRGVAVVIVGEAPSKSPGFKDAAVQDAAVVKDMQQLLGLNNVAHVASASDVATALLSLHVKPAASFGTSSPLLSVHRVGDNGQDIWWVFNPSSTDVKATGSFKTNGVPYQLDLWNGTDAVVGQWDNQQGRVVMPVALAAHATTAFVFRHGPSLLHVIATDAQEALYVGNDLVLRDTLGGIKSVVLSKGKTVTVDLGTVPAPIPVDTWHLDVDETTPAGHVSHSLDLTSLKDWRDIAELKDAVGSAAYTATVSVSGDLLGAKRDVLLDVGTMAGAMQLSVNGTLVTTQTTPGGRWSVKGLLHPGNNAISVRLDTSLLNKMAVLAPVGPYFSFMYLNVPPFGFPNKPLVPAASGLIGPVQLIPAAIARVN
jgi:hypothetical protein